MSIEFIGSDRTSLIAIKSSLLPRNGQGLLKSFRSLQLTPTRCHVLWPQVSPSSVRLRVELWSYTLTFC